MERRMPQLFFALSLIALGLMLAVVWQAGAPAWKTYQREFHRLESVNFPAERTADDAWRNFKGWRVNYESIIDALTTIRTTFTTTKSVNARMAHFRSAGRRLGFGSM